MASGRAPAKRWRRVRESRSRSALNKIMSRRAGRNCGQEMKSRRGHKGVGTRPRTMVVTVTVAVPLPDAKVFGLTAQVVALAVIGREQDKFTCAEKPVLAATGIAVVKGAL